MIKQAGKFLIGAWLLLSLLAALPQGLEASIAEEKPLWLDVDTTELKLTVMQDAKPVKVFENIAIGSNGATRDKRTMDEKTPLGDFYIMEIRRSARFKLFMAIDYPNLDHTQRAFADKRIGTGGGHQLHRRPRGRNRRLAPPEALTRQERQPDLGHVS